MPVIIKCTICLAGRKRRINCGQCEGCKRDDCGLCVFCKDMKKFGGPAKKKKACKYRVCTSLKYSESDQSATVDVDSSIQKLSGLVDKFRKLDKQSLIVVVILCYVRTRNPLSIVITSSCLY